MAVTETTIEGNLLIVSVTGDITAEEVIAVANTYYCHDHVKDVIWEFSNGSMKAITQDGYRRITKAVLVIMNKGYRQGGNTAFVGNSSLEYGLLRMYSSLAELTGIEIKYNVFNTLEEAKDWLNQA